MGKKLTENDGRSLGALVTLGELLAHSGNEAGTYFDSTVDQATT